MQEEIWRPIVGYEGYYEISNLGRVKSLERFVKGKFSLRIEKEKILVLKLTKDNYYTVGLNRLNKQKSYNVHRLLCEAFIPNPNKKPFVNHINSIRNDNNLENLEWCTHKENMEHCVKMGRIAKWDNKGKNGPPLSKLNVKKVREIRDLYYNKKMGQIKIAQLLGVSKNAISAVLTWRTWFYVDPELKEYYLTIKPTKNKNNGKSN